MGFIQDLIAPGARQMGDAASASSAAQTAISQQLMKLQEQMLGFVTHADQTGAFDPEKAAERFAASWDRNHAHDLENTAAAMRVAGRRPGDSEIDYGLQKEKTALDSQRYNGMEDARLGALQSKLGAYSMTAAPLSGASSAAMGAGQMGLAAGQAQQQGMNTLYSNLARLYGGISPFMASPGGRSNFAGGPSGFTSQGQGGVYYGDPSGTF